MTGQSTGQMHRERAEHNRSDYDVEHIDAAPQPRAEELSAETEDLLAEIDSVLEKDAEAFVSAYVQKGGE